MIALLILLAAVLVALHALWMRRFGRLDPILLIGEAIVAIGVLISVVTGSEFFLDYSWWKELGQRQTFWQYVRIRWEPQAAAMALSLIVLVAALRFGRRHSGAALARTRLFSWLGHAAAVVAAFYLAVSLIDPWTIALWLGSRDSGAYRDPIFGHSLTFYLFRLPFYRMIFAWVGFLVVLALIFYGVTIGLRASGEGLALLRRELNARARGYRGAALDRGSAWPEFAGVLRAGAMVLLLLYAAARFFARYDLLYSNHSFLYGADYVDARIGLPLLWAQIVAALGLALAVGFGPRGRRRWALGGPWRILESLGFGPEAAIALLGVVIGPPVVTAAIRAIYVRPNELTLERPYIVNHISATRSAYGIEQNSKEESFTPRQDASFDLARFPDTADNIRLWDWRPFQDDITQLQALRPYYDFPDVDLDRYEINGEKRQVMIAARSLNTDLLPESAQTWVNLHLEYTHAYGAVAGLVNEASAEGEPRLILQNAPPETAIPRFQLARPEIYFGEQTNRWTFVDTSQPEFDYPRGEDNAYNTYQGTAGIPVPSLGMRLVAAIAEDDANILLTNYLTPQSRLLLHRQIEDRVARLAPFLALDPDPYLVVDRSGRLFWMLDAYTVSDRHPYAEPINAAGRVINYIRNSVKITVDAYNGTVHFYVFDENDPVLAAYRRVFPQLFLPRSALPADLLAHIRYPEQLFRTQAEIYRIYHMADPRVFYNKEDQWDVAKQVVAQDQTQFTEPYYLMMQLPGAPEAEFVLMLPFTSHNRDNLIAWIAARCDPDQYGQILFFRLPKEQLVYGPLQVESRVDQDPEISKDLSLWNQQGSRVIRGTTLVLPVDDTFVYVEPIYIQATHARLPELRKVVLAVGSRLVYNDDLARAMAQLAQPAGAAAAIETAAASPPPAAAAGTPGSAAIPARVLESIEQHLRNYEKFTAAGQLAQAGQELEAIRRETESALDQSRTATAPGAAARAAKSAPPRRQR
ncbi:MAG TPA: UPF0182 family protein [Candidatus Acidoferrales bacterium]|nr:UPF0182 family protein [Candidatus Acidoferrales bacterium]